MVSNKDKILAKKIPGIVVWLWLVLVFWFIGFEGFASSLPTVKSSLKFKVTTQKTYLLGEEISVTAGDAFLFDPNEYEANCNEFLPACDLNSLNPPKWKLEDLPK
jgi:hypothetical protein